MLNKTNTQARAHTNTQGRVHSRLSLKTWCWLQQRDCVFFHFPSFSLSLISRHFLWVPKAKNKTKQKTKRWSDWDKAPTPTPPSEIARLLSARRNESEVFRGFTLPLPGPCGPSGRHAVPKNANNADGARRRLSEPFRRLEAVEVEGPRSLFTSANCAQNALLWRFFFTLENNLELLHSEINSA